MEKGVVQNGRGLTNLS